MQVFLISILREKRIIWSIATTFEDAKAKDKTIALVIDRKSRCQGLIRLLLLMLMTKIK